MARSCESQQFPDCVEVEICAKLIIMGEHVADVEGVAISKPNSPELQTVLLTGLDHLEIEREQLAVVDVADHAKILIANALFEAARKPWVATEMDGRLAVIESDRRLARAIAAQEFRAGA